MRFILQVAALGVGMAVAPVHAQTKAPAVDCSKAMATAELNFCADQELGREDAALNAVYRKVLTKIAVSEQPKPYDAKAWEKALRESQRAWVLWRDADCKGLVPFALTGGTATAGEVLGCMSSKTKNRAADLRARFDVE
jgi:uncharacterized protein YecT (DUF1311 family)